MEGKNYCKKNAIKVLMWNSSVKIMSSAGAPSAGAQASSKAPSINKSQQQLPKSKSNKQVGIVLQCTVSDDPWSMFIAHFLYKMNDIMYTLI